ncbi:MAG: DUF2934 domain-containing protein [Blastocatellales bacterium]|jgi:hypothetical protein|nr:DUF2934 domain-containing protein [Acidobacteriota bacterium]
MNAENTEQLHQQLTNDEEVRARISSRAYEIYLSRGCEPGCEVEDWLQAENEILASSTEGQPPRAATESTLPAVEETETKGEEVK